MSEKVVYKYFDLKARGEPSRILLTFAGIKYEDVRYTFENWPQYKAGEYTQFKTCKNKGFGSKLVGLKPKLNSYKCFKILLTARCPFSL